MTQEFPDFPDVDELASSAQKAILEANNGEMPPLASEEEQARMKEKADKYIESALNQFDSKIHDTCGDEFELFMQKVELANKAISEMKDGDLEPELFDSKYGKELELVEKKKEKVIEQKKKEKEQVKMTEEQIRVKNEERRRESGVKVCVLCNLEYTPESTQCTKCKAVVHTQKEIDENRKDKVDSIVNDIKRRRERREKWERWRKSHPSRFGGHRAKSTKTDYQKWDKWEPSDSEEERLMQDLPPADRPEFAAMEKDAEERAKRRKEKQAIAMKHKEKGNLLFREGQFDKAIEEYSEAIDLIRDNPIYYTNRAQAYIKANQLEKAVADCDKCLDLCEFLEFSDSHNSVVKALHHRANIKRMQNDWRAALEDFERAFKGAPNNKELQRCVEESKLEVEKLDEEYRVAKMAREMKKKDTSEEEKKPEESAKEEKKEEKEEEKNEKPKAEAVATKAKAAWEEGAKAGEKKSDFETIDKLLGELKEVPEDKMKDEKCNQIIWELGTLMDHDDNRTFIRQKKAVPLLAKFLKPCAEVALPVLSVVCLDAHNQRELCRVPGTLEGLVELMSGSDHTTVHLSMVLAKVLAESEFSREALVKVGAYPAIIQQIQKDNVMIRVAAVSALSNMAVDVKVKKMARESGAELIKPLLALLKDKSIRAKEVASSSLGNLSGEPLLRRIVCENDGVLSLVVALRVAMKEAAAGRDLLLSSLAALVNCALDESAPEKVHSAKAIDDLAKLTEHDNDAVVARSCTVMARSARNAAFAQSIRTGGHLGRLEKVCISSKSSEAAKEQAVRALAQCLLRDESSRTSLSKEGMLSFVKTLSLTNEHLLANSALSIANLAHVETNRPVLRPAIEPLLHVLREKRGGEGMKNSAIAMARLASEAGNLERIRDLHGIETLYQIGNYMK